MKSDEGLIYAYVLNGIGGGDPVDWKGAMEWQPDQGPLWIHID